MANGEIRFATSFMPMKSPKESPVGDGYEYNGIVGYIFRNPVAGAAPLLRWYVDGRRNHFYNDRPKWRRGTRFRIHV